MLAIKSKEKDIDIFLYASDVFKLLWQTDKVKRGEMSITRY
jgi:hypothetical protein